jgi:hypothetical protein
LHDLLDLSDLLDLDDTIDDLLDDLGHLHDLLDDPGHDHDLLDNLLDLDDLGHFDHLLDDLIDVDSDLFDAFDGAGHFDDLLHDDLDGVGLVDVVVDWLLHLDDLVDLDNLVDVLGHFDDLGDLHAFDHDLGDDLRHADDLLLVEGHLHPAIHDLLHLLVDDNRLVHDLLDLFDPVPVDDLLLDHLDLLDGGHFHPNLDHLLDGPWHFYDLLHDLDHGDGLLDDDLHNLGQFHHMVDHLACVAVLDDFDGFLDDAIEGLDHFHHLLHDLLVDDWHLDHLADDALDWDDLLADELDLADLGDGVVDDPLDEDWLLHLDDLLDYHLDLDYLGDFDDPLDHLLDDPGHFHDLFGVVGDFDYLFDDVVDVLDDLHWNVHDLLHLLDADYLNGLLDNPLDGDHLRHLHYSLDDLLDHLLHLDDLGHHAEDLQNIIHANHS